MHTHFNLIIKAYKKYYLVGSKLFHTVDQM